MDQQQIKRGLYGSSERKLIFFVLLLRVTEIIWNSYEVGQPLQKNDHNSKKNEESCHVFKAENTSFYFAC